MPDLVLLALFILAALVLPGIIVALIRWVGGAFLFSPVGPTEGFDPRNLAQVIRFNRRYNSLQRQANRLDRQGRYRECLERAIQLKEHVAQLLGRENLIYALCLMEQASAHSSLEECPAAVELLLEAARIIEPTLDENPGQLPGLERIPPLLLHCEEYDHARAMLERVLAFRTKMFGAESPELMQTLQLLGGVCIQAGNRGAAVPYFQQLLKIQRAVGGDDHPAAVQTWRVVGNLQLEQEDAASAEVTLRGLLEALQRSQKPAPDQVLEVTTALATLNEKAGRTEEAERLFQQAIELTLSHPHQRHDPMAGATAFLNLIGLYCRHGRRTEAEAVLPRLEEALLRAVAGDAKRLEQGLLLIAQDTRSEGHEAVADLLVELVEALERRSLDETAPDYPVRLLVLARQHAAAGDYAGAVSRCETALNLIPEGEDGTASRGAVLFLRADLEQEQGHHEAAHTRYEEAGEVIQREKGEASFEYALTLAKRAQVQLELVQYETAQALAERAREIATAALGPRDPEITPILAILAAIYRARGNYDEAEPLYREVVERWRIAVATVGSPAEARSQLASSLNNLAVYLMAAGKVEEAEPPFRESLPLLAATVGKDHPSYMMTLTSLAGTYHALGREREGLALQREAMELAQRHLPPEHPLWGTLTNNAANLAASGPNPAAEAELRRSLDQLRETVGEHHPRYAATLQNLAGRLAARDQVEEAEDMLRQATEIRVAVLGEEHPDTVAGLKELAQLMFTTGNSEAAGPILRRLVRLPDPTRQNPHTPLDRVLARMAEMYELAAAQGLELPDEEPEQMSPVTDDRNAPPL